MALILKYKEKRTLVQRSYHLYPDHIVIHTQQFLRAKAEISIPLKSLNPQPDRVWQKDPLFQSEAITTLLLVVIGYCFLLLFRNTSMPWLPLLIFAPGVLSGLWLMVLSYPTLEFRVFKNKNGVVLFDFARTGKSSGNFENFSQAITTQILKEKEL